MPAFIQVIEWSSSRIDEVRKLGESRRAEMQSGGGPVRVTITADRNTPNRYMTIVEFASYEEAMRNSQDPATDAFAKEMARLCDGPPTFHDLDVIETHILTTGARSSVSS